MIITKKQSSYKKIRVLSDSNCDLCSIQKNIIRSNKNFSGNIRFVNRSSKEGKRIEKKFGRNIEGYPTMVVGSGKKEKIVRVGVQGNKSLKKLINEVNKKRKKN